jgi:hypothetical protein
MPNEVKIEEVARGAHGVFGRLSGRGEAFGYDRDSLAWVENYLESNRGKLTEPEFNSLIQLTGAYLGECVRQAYGGQWLQKDGAWGIFFERNNAAFPFAKAQKFMESGLAAGDSITGFFDVVPLILNKAL